MSHNLVTGFGFVNRHFLLNHSMNVIVRRMVVVPVMVPGGISGSTGMEAMHCSECVLISIDVLLSRCP